MRPEHPLLQEDIHIIAMDDAIPWEDLRDSTILVTGATGLLGGLLCKSLLHASVVRSLNLTVLALARSREHVESILGPEKDTLQYIIGDINEPFSFSQPVRFCIHAAAPTASSHFVEKPVETIDAVFNGTANMLKLAQTKHVKSMLYLSSMEVYGKLDHLEAREEDSGFLDTLAARSSYPQAKRLAETLCAAYASEYDLPVKIARPTQVIGPGVKLEDNRVFMQMARAALAKSAIRLATNGATEREYIYTADACRILLSILLKGENGKAYNISNKDTYISILELAKIFKKFEPKIEIVINSGDNKFYLKETHLRLHTNDTVLLHKFAMTNIETMVKRLLLYYTMQK